MPGHDPGLSPSLGERQPRDQDRGSGRHGGKHARRSARSRAEPCAEQWTMPCVSTSMGKRPVTRKSRASFSGKWPTLNAWPPLPR